MPTAAQKQNMTSAIGNLRSAEQCLDDVITKIGDPSTLAELTAEYRTLNDLVNNLNQAQTIADDKSFKQATAGLNAQAADLKAQEAHIKQIVTDVGIAAKILGYIAQAVTFIGAL